MNEYQEQLKKVKNPHRVKK